MTTATSDGAAPFRADTTTPTFSLEAEQAVLGGLMLDATVYPAVAGVVDAQDFFRADHRTLFGALKALHSQGVPLDVVTVGDHLRQTGKLSEVGGLPYLADMARNCPTAVNLKAYATIVRKRSLERRRQAAWNAGRHDEVTALTEQIKRLEKPEAPPLCDLSEFGIGDYLDTPPPRREYLLEELLPLGKTGLLVAPGGTGKSQLLIQLGIAIATGYPLCGQWQVGRPGRVLMLFAEDDREELHRRIHNRRSPSQRRRSPGA